MMASGQFYTLGEYFIDTRALAVTHQGQEVALAPIAARLLCLLASTEGVSRREHLIAKLWPMGGSEASLNQAAFLLRKGLDQASPGTSHYLKTVPWLGYQLALPATPIRSENRASVTPAAMLRSSARLLSQDCTGEALNKATLLYRRSLQLEDHPDSWLGLSEVYANLPLLGAAYPCEAEKQAKLALTKANPADPRAAVVRATLAFGTGANHEKVENQLRPGAGAGVPSALHRLGMLLCLQGRYESGLDYLRAAVVAEPLSVLMRADLAQAELLAGEHTSALSTVLPLIEVRPQSARARLLQLLATEGDRGSNVLEKSIRPHEDPMAYAGIGCVLGRRGQKALAEEIAATIVRRRQAGKFQPWYAEVLAYTGAGQDGKARFARSRANNAFDGSHQWAAWNPLPMSFVR